MGPAEKKNTWSLEEVITNQAVVLIVLRRCRLLRQHRSTFVVVRHGRVWRQFSQLLYFNTFHYRSLSDPHNKCLHATPCDVQPYDLVLYPFSLQRRCLLRWKRFRWRDDIDFRIMVAGIRAVSKRAPV